MVSSMMRNRLSSSERFTIGVVRSMLTWSSVTRPRLPTTSSGRKRSVWFPSVTSWMGPVYGV
jgi:hypothetical protein